MVKLLKKKKEPKFQKKAVKKAVIKKTKPKSVATSKKKLSTSKQKETVQSPISAKPLLKKQKILTAEGWKYLMMQREK